MNEPQNKNIPAPMFVSVVFEGGLGLLAILLGWALGYPVLTKITWNAYHFGLAVISILPLLLIFFGMVVLPFSPVQKIKTIMEKFLAPLFGRASVIDLFMISVISGVSEEILFRGFLFELVGYYSWQFPALVVTSLLFGAAHLITILYGGIAFAMGLYLGYSLMYTGNLMTPIVIHTLYNFFVFIYYLKIRKPDYVPESDRIDD